MHQPAADRVAAGTAAREQRAGGHLSPRQRARVAWSAGSSLAAASAFICGEIRGIARGLRATARIASTRMAAALDLLTIASAPATAAATRRPAGVYAE